MVQFFPSTVSIYSPFKADICHPPTIAGCVFAKASRWCGGERCGYLVWSGTAARGLWPHPGWCSNGERDWDTTYNRNLLNLGAFLLRLIPFETFEWAKKGDTKTKFMSSEDDIPQMIQLWLQWSMFIDFLHVLSWSKPWLKGPIASTFDLRLCVEKSANGLLWNLCLRLINLSKW